MKRTRNQLRAELLAPAEEVEVAPPGKNDTLHELARTA